MGNQKDVDIKRLAGLARVSVSEEEESGLEEQIRSILDFVKEIQSVDVSNVGQINTEVNVLREDKNPHEGGIYTDVLMTAAPATEKGYVKVKRVIKGGKHS